MDKDDEEGSFLVAHRRGAQNAEETQSFLSAGRAEVSLFGGLLDEGIY